VKSVVLLSGGVDSTVVLARSVARGDEVLAVTFDYGQTHVREVDAAERIADHYGVGWRLAPFPLSGSALTGDEVIPDGHAEAVDATYVPARNLVMVSVGAHFAERFGAACVLIGANADDEAGYPDCRPKFITAMDEAVAVGTSRGVSVSAPLIAMTKQQILDLGRELGAPLGFAWSCYRGGARPCGTCGACVSLVAS
jgi:7-cyano-7-deazaguanine synthase